MTNDDPAALVARAKELLANATPGPWHRDGFHMSAVIRKNEHKWERVADCDREGFRNPNWDADAAFIAAAPTLIADLVSALDAALAREGRLREAFLWAVENGMTVRLNKDGTLYIRDSGCGCCSDYYPCPEHLEATIRAALAPDAKEEPTP